MSRPLVGVQTGEANAKSSSNVKLPYVFRVPVRPDLVNEVFARMNKNRRQAYSVSKFAGHQTSAESWGTGRAVARIPRVPGGGTHRAGQGAFGNMCRGGRMFAPTKTWRRWHRKINITEKRYALTSAIAASAIPALVMARGHKIESVAEIPLVIDNKAVDSLDKTSKARALLKSLNAFDDVSKVIDSKRIRTGQGKARNRRYVQRRGPLVIFNNKGPITKAFRNLPGVELAHVSRLNLLQLAPGGHLGRFCIWTKDAFEMLDTVYGTNKTASSKAGYRLPRSIMTNSDLGRIINSDEIQSVIRNKRSTPKVLPKRNPLKNMKTLGRLNPYALAHRRRVAIQDEARQKKRAELLESKRKGTPVVRSEAEKKEGKRIKTQRKAIHKKTAAYRKHILGN